MKSQARPKIIRAPHSKDRPYFSMARQTAQNRNLSWEARGVLCYLLSKPDDWQLKLSDLQQSCGRDKVYRIVDELTEAGYLKRVEQNRDDKGHFTPMYYQVYEIPFPENPHTDSPDTGLPDTDKPHTANPQQHNTESTDSENEQSIEKQKPEPQLQPQTPSGGSLENRPNIYRVWEENMGPLSPTIAETLRDAVEVYTETWVVDAIKESVLRGKYNNWRYTEGILKRWKTNGRETKDSAPTKPADPAPVIAVPSPEVRARLLDMSKPLTRTGTDG